MTNPEWAGPGIDMADVAMTVQIRGVYDGWCYAEMKDGRLMNRWEPGTGRYRATQEVIDAVMRDRERWEQTRSE